MFFTDRPEYNLSKLMQDFLIRRHQRYSKANCCIYEYFRKYSHFISINYWILPWWVCQTFLRLQFCLLCRCVSQILCGIFLRLGARAGRQQPALLLTEGHLLTARQAQVAFTGVLLQGCPAMLSQVKRRDSTLFQNCVKRLKSLLVNKSSTILKMTTRVSMLL